MHLNLYKIEGTTNLDSHGCFHSEDTYSNFQEGLDKFKNHLVDLVDNKESKTFYKCFVKKMKIIFFEKKIQSNL